MPPSHLALSPASLQTTQHRAVQRTRNAWVFAGQNMHTRPRNAPKPRVSFPCLSCFDASLAHTSICSSARRDLLTGLLRSHPGEAHLNGLERDNQPVMATRSLSLVTMLTSYQGLPRSRPATRASTALAKRADTEHVVTLSDLGTRSGGELCWGLCRSFSRRCKRCR